jgi:uncharacterized protein (DUF2461 family)
MSADAKMFRGWPAEALESYEGLEGGNSTAYWTAHKDVYETVVLSAMKAIPAELAPEFGDGKLFRPNRDVRFSTDKSPYKTHIGSTCGTQSCS